MNQDDYQKKFDEHRQSIGQEDDSVESRRSRRNPSKKPNKKSKNLLIPTLFSIFILIPVCILMYVQFFYTPELQDEKTKEQAIHVETKPISNSTEDDATEEDELPEEVVAEEIATTIPKTEVKEQPKVEQPKVEVKEEPEEVEVVKEEPEEVQQKTHQVQPGENLYRIAKKYYNYDAVEKIKAANGLTSNEISVGQKLILP